MRSDSRVRNEVEFIDANSSEHRYLELAARIQTLSASLSLFYSCRRRFSSTRSFNALQGWSTHKTTTFQTSQIPPSQSLISNNFSRSADCLTSSSSSSLFKLHILRSFVSSSSIASTERRDPFLAEQRASLSHPSLPRRPPTKDTKQTTITRYHKTRRLISSRLQ